MKGRVLALFAAAVIGAAAAYAEDATVLPAGTLRFDVVASTGFVRGGWDGDGKKADAPNAVIIGTTPGLAFGFTHWFTAVLDWSPGVTDTDLAGIDIGADGDGEAEIYEGLSDFVLKAQFQIIGDNAPIKTKRFRMRLAPGMVIPFPGIDGKDALGNHRWGAGGGVSLDALFTDTFFVNAFSEAYWFPAPTGKSGTEWAFTLEAGPHYTITIGTVRLVFALPVNWKMAPEMYHYNGASTAPASLLSVRPALELKLTHPFAVNIGIEYTLPLYGKNNYAIHTITIKWPVYFNFAKKKEGA
jgi:hypothetical protein